VIILAGAFGTFALFLLLGLLALPVTAMLDKSIGKEKGLLIYAGLLLAFTAFVLAPGGPKGHSYVAKSEKDIKVGALVGQGDPFARPAPDSMAERNAFRPYSDTRPLPPITLDAPPWIALDFALPPTVPGPAPGQRQILRGPLPKLTAGDGSAITQAADATFATYQRTPADVYDWIVLGNGKPYYVYVLALKSRDEAKWHVEGSEAYERLKWTLAEQGDGFEDLWVRYAVVGPEAQASKYLADLEILGRKLVGRSDRAAKEEAVGGWHLRRTIANLYAEALKRQGYDPNADIHAFGTAGHPTIHPGKLRRAAAEMAEAGRTGKESHRGWRKAIELLEVALTEVRANRSAQERAEVLLEVLGAQRALHDEQAVLRTLAEYMRTAPRSAEARTWLGQLHLTGMQLPTEALHYFDAALARDARFGPALLGRGEALSFLGDHGAALDSFRLGTDEAAHVHTATAQLRLGLLREARGTAESVLSREPTDMEATLVRACVLYAQGDLETARGAFEQVATSPDALALRARASYDLGLTCIRLGQHDAALAAFAACEKALENGSSMGPTPDETVSPSFGRALVAYAAGNEHDLVVFLEMARREAPRSAYIEMFAGMEASLDKNDASAIRALEAALRDAPGYAELDGWLGKTYLRLAESEAKTSASAAETAETFERAIAFAGRAADRESSADRKAYAARLREAFVRIRASHLPTKQRYRAALAAVQKVLDTSELREQPAALAMAGYCNFQLGLYKECIRAYQQVLDVVPDEDEHAWKSWRDYAEGALRDVKHWRNLEEKIVTFKGTNLDRAWAKDVSHGPNVRVENGALHFVGASTHDGRRDDPTVVIKNGTLFARDTFETLTVTLRIPREVRGQATNNITFGVELIADTGRGGTSKKKRPGIGVFYDKNKIAVRVQGGQEKKYKEGSLLRVEPEQLWPETDEVTVRFVREDAKKGVMAVYLNDRLVLRDRVSTFKGTKGKAALWIGGFATETQPFDVWVRDIRVVRKIRGR